MSTPGDPKSVATEDGSAARLVIHCVDRAGGVYVSLIGQCGIGRKAAHAASGTRKFKADKVRSAALIVCLAKVSWAGAPAAHDTENEANDRSAQKQSHQPSEGIC